MTKITAVIPAFNESSRIINTLEKLKPYVDEILVIDDASSDNTSELARQHGAKTLLHSTNMGYIQSIKTGFHEATGEIIITIDADGEFPVDSIPELIQPIIDNKADMVQGHRDIVPRPSERFLTWLSQRKLNVGDSGTGLRAIRSTLARSLELHGECICGIFSFEVASKGGRIAEIPIKLQKTSKPRKVAWFHIRQFFYLIPWLFKNYNQHDKE